MSTPKPTIAAFDFDGTLTTKDTLFHFARFVLGPVRFWWSIFLFLPRLLLYLSKLQHGDPTKIALLRIFYKNNSEPFLRKKAIEYLPHLQNIINPEALEKLRWHQAQGHKVCIVSASPEFWIRPWAHAHGVELVIATELEFPGGIFLGKYARPNCIEGQKVVRLLEHFPQKESYTLYAYGDSAGDKQLLELADEPFFRRFN
jgi:phosphatidylglycerophosphatase C